jgi:hypothetical protein
MRILTISAAVMMAAAGAAPAFAADARLSDSQFVKAAHRRGLATGEAAATFDALLKAQKRGRSDHIIDRAHDARGDGERLARTDAAAAQAELAGACAKFAA